MATDAEQRELQLVDKVEFRILAVANNEQKLTQLLKVYLAPLLLKAESEYASVRSKVVIIAQRLKTFIQPAGVVLPVPALVDQYKKTQSSLLKQLDVTFIQHSIGRLESLEDRRAVIPKLLKGVGTDRSAALPSLFNVFLRSLSDLRVPPRGSSDDESFREAIGLADAEDAQFVAFWLGKILLFRPGVTNTGVKEDEIKFLTLDKPETWDASQPAGLKLVEIRVKAAQFLASGAFKDQERFLPALYASASPDSRISSIGDELLKRSAVSLEDPDMVVRLFDAHAVLAPAYRTRILGLLSKSAVSTTYSDKIINAVHRDLEKGPSQLTTESTLNGSTGSGGLERTKLRKALFEYLGWIARIGSSKPDFNAVAVPLITLLREFIEEQGWPRSTERLATDEITLREKAYETIGTLARGARMDDQAKLSLAGFLFRSLAEDPLPEVVVNVDGALSSLALAFHQPQSDGVTTALPPMLMTYMTIDEQGSIARSARHAATKWANECLPYDDLHARWIDILAVAGRKAERSDVIEEGKKGLDPWNYRVDSAQTPKLPAWEGLVASFFFKQKFNLSLAASQPSASDSCFQNFPGDTLQAFPVAVDYIKNVLFLKALPEFKLEPGWAERLQTSVRSDLKTRKTLREYLRAADQVTLRQLLTTAFEGMLLDDHPGIVEICASAFVDLASCSPKMVTKELAERRTMELLAVVKSNRKEIRHSAARAFGILAAHPVHVSTAVSNSISTLGSHISTWKTAVGSEMSAVEGAMLAAGYLASRRVYYLGRGAAGGPAEELQKYLLEPKEAAEKLNKSAQEALFEAVSELWTAGILLGSRSSDTTGASDTAKEWISALAEAAKKGNEKAIVALGRLPIALSSISGMSDDLIDSILQKLYDLHELKNVEIQLTIGEAITAAIAGWDADVVKLTLDVDTTSEDFILHAQASRLETSLAKVLKDCRSTKPSLLKASGIWLFCIVNNCSGLPQIQAKLRECQAAFMGLLSARDTLVQETASRGLSLVYEKGDEALRGELVKDLVSAFTGSGPRLKVEQDTELFDAGALPTGEGSSVTSYKDIVNLANEVGDQSLVYRFMSLASNAATWNTRSAFGRFGLSNILSESAVDPKLYPKLYRYRFDPNTNVRRSMEDIWKALVKDSNAVIDEHFDDIIQDLLKSILGREWRVREASCAAIAELLQGRPFAKYEKYYQDIWTAALKVLDDVKATVREAALALCISLSTTLTRLLEESGSKSTTTTAMMKEAMPFLLSEKGIESSTQDVKLFSTMTVIKIAKAGGKALSPFIELLVPQLLGLLSTIEPEQLNYQYQRMGEAHREKLDKLRSQMINQSPIMEAIENALRNLDKDSIPGLTAALEETAKTALGMPTKLGTARVLTVLATSHSNSTVFGTQAPRFLRLMEKLVLERNDEVSQAYAASAAYILRAAPSAAQLKYADRLGELYFAAEDETRREKVAYAVTALSKISPDHFVSLEASLLPLAYFASHDEDEYVSHAMGSEVWEKHAGASARGIRRFATEIVSLVEKALDKNVWALKHAGALTAAGVVGAASSSADGIMAADLKILHMTWPVYERALALKTFPRKDELLEALPGFADAVLGQSAGPNGANGKASDSITEQTLHKIVVREAKRNNEAYKPHAFKCLWRFARGRESLDMWDEVVSIVMPSLEALKEKADEMDVDSKSGKDSKAADKERSAKKEKEDSVNKAAEAAVEAIAKAFPPKRLGASGSDPALLAKIVDVLKPFLSADGFSAIKRKTWYGCVEEIFNEATKSYESLDGTNETGATSTATRTPLDRKTMEAYVESLDLGSAASGTEEQRTNRVKAVMALIKALKAGLFGKGMTDSLASLKRDVDNALEAERAMDVRKLWKDVLLEMRE